MNMLLQFGLSNAVFAFALALLAWCVSRLGNNRHAAHALWVLVLVKLVTPPVWSVPMSLPSLSSGEELQLVEAPSNRSAANDVGDTTVRNDETKPIVSMTTAHVVVDSDPAVRDCVAKTTAPARPEEVRVSWATIVVSSWLLTSVLWALVVLVRIARFQRVIQVAESASSDLIERTRRMARALGLKTCPDLRVFAGNVSPMMWPLARRRTILLPRRLADELTPEQLDTVITHELAHLVRRDDLVRFLEALATCLFWWNPVVWWARRELRSAEEDCCDALVVCSLPNARLDYGAALLRAAEVMTFGRSLPVLATQLGEQRFLKRRIEMILTQTLNRSASWRAKLAVVALAIVVLPFAATTVSVGEDPKRNFGASDAAVPAKELGADKDKSERPAAGAKPRHDAAKNVVAHWRFQKGLDDSVADSSRLIEDSSGNDHHGRAFGGPKYCSVNLPKSNRALAFDGYDDRILVADHEDFELTKSFTIEAYIEADFYPESASEECHIVFRGDNRHGFDPWFLSVTQSGQLRFMIADALNEASVVQSSLPIPTGKLIHVAATLEDETGKQSLFINGKRVATTKTRLRACGPLGGTGAGIGIGNRQQHSNQAFRGTIDELRISSAALSPAEFLAAPDSER